MNRWRVADVMTAVVVSVRPHTGYQRVADLLVQHAISAAPVVDEDGSVLGEVSAADLLPKLNYPERVPRIRWCHAGGVRPTAGPSGTPRAS